MLNGEKRRYLKACAVCGAIFLVNAELAPFLFESQGVHFRNHLDKHTHQESHSAQPIISSVVAMTTNTSAVAISGNYRIIT